MVDDTLWFIPGGRVEFHEMAEETIEREMKEEFAVPILNKRLVWMVENFVDFPERRLHEIGLFYLVDLPLNHKIFQHDKEFVGEEDMFINKWVPIEMLDQYKVIPDFVVPELRLLDIDKGIKYIKSRSIR